MSDPEGVPLLARSPINGQFAPQLSPNGVLQPQLPPINGVDLETLTNAETKRSDSISPSSQDLKAAATAAISTKAKAVVTTLRKRVVGTEDEKEAETRIRRFANVVKQVDLFPKADEDVTLDTKAGLVTTLVTLFIIIVLLLSQWSDYSTVKSRHRMTVDKQRPGEELSLHFNLSMHRIRCSLANLDIMDVTGHHQEDVHRGVLRQRLSSDGRHVGQPTDADEEGEDAPGEGCQLSGTLRLKKVGGNLHIAVGGTSNKYKGTRHVHVFNPTDLRSFNASHTFHWLRFGDRFDQQLDPIAGTSAYATDGPTHYKYFLKIVPTTYINQVTGVVLDTHQYSVSNVSVVMEPDKPKPGSGIPGLFLVYDFSPFRVRIEEYYTPLSTFLVNICAVLGGVVTIIAVVDALVFRIYNQFTKQ